DLGPRVAHLPPAGGYYDTGRKRKERTLKNRSAGTLVTALEASARATLVVVERLGGVLVGQRVGACAEIGEEPVAFDAAGFAKARRLAAHGVGAGVVMHRRGPYQLVGIAAAQTVAQVGDARAVAVGRLPLGENDRQRGRVTVEVGGAVDEDISLRPTAGD